MGGPHSQAHGWASFPGSWGGLIPRLMGGPHSQAHGWASFPGSWVGLIPRLMGGPHSQAHGWASFPGSCGECVEEVSTRQVYVLVSHSNNHITTLRPSINIYLLTKVTSPVASVVPTEDDLLPQRGSKLTL